MSVPYLFFSFWQENVKLLIDKSQRGEITTQITLEESVTAPVSKGQKLGTLTVKAGDQVLTQVNLVAEEAVERLSWWDVFTQILRKLCMSKGG